MNESRVITKLGDLDLQLGDNEQIIQIIENGVSDNYNVIYKIHQALLWIVIVLFAYLNFIVGVIIAIILVVGESFSEQKWLTTKISGLPIFKGKGKTVISNQRLILPSKMNVFWKEIYNLEKYRNGKQIYVLLSLQPDRIESDDVQQDIEYKTLRNTIEHSSYILLGSGSNANEILERIKPYWLKNGAPRELQKTKERLVDLFNMRVSRRQTYLEMLTSKYDDFTLNYTHKNRYPVNSFQLSIDFKQPIPAFLKISRENIKSQLKQAVGLKDFEVGNGFIDKHLNIHGSHAEEIKKIFSHDLNRKLKILIMDGIIDFKFGEPINKKQLKNNKRHRSDSEDVLDIQLTADSKEATEVEFKGTTALTFTVKTIGNVSLPKEKIQQFAQTFIEVGLQIANGLKTLQ